MHARQETAAPFEMFTVGNSRQANQDSCQLLRDIRIRETLHGVLYLLRSRRNMTLEESERHVTWSSLLGARARPSYDYVNYFQPQVSELQRGGSSRAHGVTCMYNGYTRVFCVKEKRTDKMEKFRWTDELTGRQVGS